MTAKPKIIPHPRFERIDYLVAIIQSASITGRLTSAMNLVEFYYLAGIDPYFMIQPKYYREDLAYPIPRNVFEKCAAAIDEHIRRNDISEWWYDELLRELGNPTTLG